MKKDTSKLIEELGLCPDFQSFYNENQDQMVTRKRSEILDSLLQQKNLKKSRVIRDAEISEVYAYQIFSGKRVPERKKLLSLAIGMQLNLEETQSLLKCGGYPPLYVKLPFDSVVLYGICKHLSVPQINELLYYYTEETLGTK